jgi:hypothetical protein
MGTKNNVEAKSFWTDAIGWYYTGSILLAYGLNSLAVVHAESWSYQLLNLTGALAAVYLGQKKKAPQVVVLNATWAVIAIVAMARKLV